VRVGGAEPGLERGEKIEEVGMRVKRRACTNIRPFYDNRQDNIRRLESARLFLRRAYRFEDLKRAKLT
jgi:hypothetical protein